MDNDTFQNLVQIVDFAVDRFRQREEIIAYCDNIRSGVSALAYTGYLTLKLLDAIEATRNFSVITANPFKINYKECV